MAEFQWNEHIKITLGQMSWKRQLACTRDFQTWIENVAMNQDSFARQTAIVTMIVLHSPIRVYRDGVELPNGTHDIDDAIIALPLTEDSMNELPASIVMFLVKAAQEVNAAILASFLDGLTVTKATMFVPSPVSTP